MKKREGLEMAALPREPMMITEEGYLIGRYSRSGIAELTFNQTPFLLIGEAWVSGPKLELDAFDEIISFSIVSGEDCAGHFGPKFPSGPENLKIPLLHLSRIMTITSQIAARLIYPEKIPVLVGGKNIRANNQNLISPPATVTARASNFKANGTNFSARTLGRANGEPYAEIEELSFKLITLDNFTRTGDIVSEIPDELLRGCKIKREMYRSDIEELILEREPFHRLDRAILLQSPKGDLKLVTISKITKADCSGQLVIDGQSSLSLVDYSRLMALTAELLASIVTRERFDDFLVVPIAVKVDKVDTPNLLLFSPPVVVIAEASISAKNLYDPRMIKRGKQLFWADSASAWIDNVEVARMDKIVYALVPEDKFFEENNIKYKNDASSVINPRHKLI
ncbi:MAG: hypothetical protein ABIG90_01835 [bacterium]